MSGIFSAPMDHGRLSVQVGFDELGRPVYRTPLGHLVGQATPEAPQRNALATMLRTEVDPTTGRAIHYQDEMQPTRTGNALAALMQGIAQGFTAPGRAARGEPVTLGDVWATALDNGALAAPMRAPAGAIRSGALATEGPADEVARMLREGRAAEITDEMMARLTPEDNVRLFRLYEEGATGQPMPMDERSRMRRARSMGLSMRSLHGSDADISAFSSIRPGGSPGIYTSGNPDVADVYARRSQDLGLDGSPNYIAVMQDPTKTNRFGADYRVIYDPTRIRSRFARFDPRLSHLAHLSAGGAGVAVLGGESEQGGWEAARQYLREIGALE